MEFAKLYNFFKYNTLQSVERRFVYMDVWEYIQRVVGEQRG